MAIVNEEEIAGLEPADGEQQLQIPNELPVLPLRDIVIYPFMIVPLFVSREKSIRAVDEALGENRMIFLVSQRDLDKEEPAGEDLYTTDRKSTRLNSSHDQISYAVFCLKKKKN